MLARQPRTSIMIPSFNPPKSLQKKLDSKSLIVSIYMFEWILSLEYALKRSIIRSSIYRRIVVNRVRWLSNILFIVNHKHRLYRTKVCISIVVDFVSKKTCSRAHTLLHNKKKISMQIFDVLSRYVRIS